jgi:3-aminobutyryl-CoA ammonia-lyase
VMEPAQTSGPTPGESHDRSAGAGRPDTRADAASQQGAAVTVTHRRYVPYSHAHYAGNLVDGAYLLGLFGDVATELMILLDGDEGLFASYADVQFLGPVHGGDVVEVSASLLSRGRRSRRMRFTAQVVCRAAPERSPSAADVLPEPLLVTTAEGTVVAPEANRSARMGPDHAAP